MGKYVDFGCFQVNFLTLLDPELCGYFLNQNNLLRTSGVSESNQFKNRYFKVMVDYIIGIKSIYKFQKR